MRKSRIGLAILSLIMVFALAFMQVSAAAPAPKVETITVSAAASLKDSLTEIQKQFEADNKNIQLQFNFGASGTLSKQIQEGAPVDLFMAADTKSVADLDAKNLVVKKSIKNLLANEIVLLVHKDYKDRIKSLNDLSKEGARNIALGTPESVPAGAYAKESLTYYNLWPTVSGKVVYGKDVKQVMTYVESGNAMAGIVYSTDAKLAKNSVVAQVIPAASHKPILYASAVISNSKHQVAAQKALDYMSQSKAQEIFKKYGFTIVTAEK